MYSDSRSTANSSISTIIKYLIAVLCAVNIALLFGKWISIWGESFSLLGLKRELDEFIGSSGLSAVIVFQFVSALACVYSLVRTFWEGHDFERAIGFVVSLIYTAVVMIRLRGESDGYGLLGPQLTSVPTIIIILCVTGALLSFFGNTLAAALGGNVPAPEIHIDGSKITGAIKTSIDNISSKAKTIGTVTCSCGAILVSGDKFCPKCGQKRPESPRCAVCGALLAKDAAFCSKCGARVGKVPAVDHDEDSTHESSTKLMGSLTRK